MRLLPLLVVLASSSASAGPRVGFTKVDAKKSTTLTPGIVLVKIGAAYFAGLKRCYAAQLGRGPNARGKAELAFTVGAAGRITDKAVTHAFDRAFGECVESQMKSWRFPIPRDAGGTPTAAAFAIHLTLTPS